MRYATTSTSSAAEFAHADSTSTGSRHQCSSELGTMVTLTPSACATRYSPSPGIPITAASINPGSTSARQRSRRTSPTACGPIPLRHNRYPPSAAHPSSRATPSNWNSRSITDWLAREAFSATVCPPTPPGESALSSRDRAALAPLSPKVTTSTIAISSLIARRPCSDDSGAGHTGAESAAETMPVNLCARPRRFSSARGEIRVSAAQMRLSPPVNGLPARVCTARLRDSRSLAGTGNGMRMSWSVSTASTRRVTP